MSNDSIEAQFEANEREAAADWEAGYDRAKADARQDLRDMQRRLQNYANETQEIASERNQLRMKAFKQNKRIDALTAMVRELADKSDCALENFANEGDATNAAAEFKGSGGVFFISHARLRDIRAAVRRARALIGEDVK